MFMSFSGRHSNKVWVDQSSAEESNLVKFEFLLWASTEREHVPCHSMDAYLLVEQKSLKIMTLLARNTGNVF